MSDQNQEEWKFLPLEVSSRGRLRLYGEIIEPSVDNRGYRYHLICSKRIPLHRLVALAHLGPMPFDGAVVRHLNDVKGDNRAKNLAYGTQGQNNRDKVRNKRTVRGQKVGTSKLSDHDVLDIRLLYAGGTTQNELADRYGVTQETIGLIIRGSRWTHIIKDSISKRRTAKEPRRLTESEAREIKRRYLAGESCAKLVSEFGVERTTPPKIARGASWMGLS